MLYLILDKIGLYSYNFHMEVLNYSQILAYIFFILQNNVK